MIRPTVQECPICRAQQSIDARRCSQCGAALNGVPVVARLGSKLAQGRGVVRALDGPVGGDWDQGETDLHEGTLPSGTVPLLIALVILILFAGGSIYAVQRFTHNPTATPDDTFAGLNDLKPTYVRGAALPTNTKPVAVIPTSNLPTVTTMPPSPTITPTRGPCTQTVKKGDTISLLALRCGNHDASVIDEIMKINGMTSPSQLQIGQLLDIPWPTATIGPANVPAPAAGTGTPQQQTNGQPTLPPGVTYYTVKKGDTALSIIYKLNSSMKILEDLNHDVHFDSCDIGFAGGGPACQVILYEGQKIRVPGPLPTATLSPTPNGSETATPSITPTFNAPFSQSPGDNMLFEATEAPTLRWVTSGQLTVNQEFLITVTDTTTNATYYGTTHDLSFEVPAEWQPSDGGRHVFQWRVSIANIGTGGTPVPSAYTTEVRSFTWRSK